MNVRFRGRRQGQTISDKHTLIVSTNIYDLERKVLDVDAEPKG